MTADPYILPFNERTVVDVEKLVSNLLEQYKNKGPRDHLFFVKDKKVASAEQTQQLINELLAYVGEQ